MNQLFRLKKFIDYQWKAKTKYYLHSPFVYQFYLNVLEGTNDEQLLSVRELRKKLREKETVIATEDFGTGKSSSATIADLERHVAVREKYGALLYRLVRYFKPVNILELGTSIGISSSYMALASRNAKIISIEGSPNLVEEAGKNHSSLGITNVELVSGNFDEILPSCLKKLSALDLIFFDGNHRQAATLKYFEQCIEKADENSIFVFDDIYRNQEMSQMWTSVKQHPQITLTLDVFQFGICFFRKEKLAKENFVLRY